MSHRKQRHKNARAGPGWRPVGKGTRGGLQQQDAPTLGYGWLERVHPNDRERLIARWHAAAAGTKISKSSSACTAVTWPTA
jgi:hypothetical protein